jgi:nucleotide-binding universal stress UspA family protein
MAAMKDIKTILLTTDLSETSKKAVDPALTLAKKFGAKIILVFVGDLFPPFLEQYYVAINFEQIRKDADERARKELAEFAEKNLGRAVPVEQVVALGIPHMEIVNLAKERKADLIVMATHGRGFISHAMMGSTTERVLHHAPCPVLAIREPAGH